MDLGIAELPSLIETSGFGTGGAVDIAAAGDYLFVACPPSRVDVLRTFQRDFDTDANTAWSLVVAETDDDIVRAAVTATWTGSIAWELSANNGYDWSPAGAGGGYFRPLAHPGTKLMWRSTLQMADPGVSPACTEMRIDWLYNFAIIDSIVDVPGDEGNWARIHFTRSGRDFTDEAAHPVTGYNVYRRIDESLAASSLAGGGAGVAERPTPQLLGMPPGAWEAVVYVAAQQEAEYICLVPTLADSSAVMLYSAYCILAATTTPSVYYISPPDSGYSVDNLPPPAPAGFTVNYRSLSNLLTWGACAGEDCASFRIYRGTEPDFTPDPGNLVHETSETVWIDYISQGWLYCYKITAVDESGNESEPAAPENVVAVGEPVIPGRFALRQNAPNPFNPTTTISFDLPRAAHVKLCVYNVKGELVASLVDRHMAEGRKEVAWSARDSRGCPVSSGIYFCRLVAGDYVQTKKMVLLR